MALIRGENYRKFQRIHTVRRSTLKNIYILLLLTFGFSQDYSLSDINANSATFGIEVGPSYFSGQITLHYFGHQN